MFDSIPIWALFIFVLVVVLITMEVGYRLMKMKVEQSKPENEPLVSAIAAAGLGLLGFVLAFTFGIVYARYETRKELVRQEANAIRRVWLRSDFMEQPDRSSTVGLLRKYLDIRLQLAQSRSFGDVESGMSQSEAIQRQLWDLGVANAKRNSLSGMNAPFIQSLSDLIDINSQRLAIGARDRIPAGIWVVLGGLLLLSMLTIGYFSGAKGAKRSASTIILALSFSLMFVLVSALDNPLYGLFTASQQPLLTVKASINN